MQNKDSFDNWNEIKKQTQDVKMRLTIKPREIYWAKIGQNIGDEEYGKGKLFSRPVLIVAQLTSDLFIGLPTTTALHDDSKYFHNIEYKDNRNKNIKSSCMILQIRTFSKKRLTSKVGSINKEDFAKIKEKLRDLFPPN